MNLGRATTRAVPLWRWQQQNDDREKCHWIIMKLPSDEQQHHKHCIGKKCMLKSSGIGQQLKWYFLLFRERLACSCLYWCLFLINNISQNSNEVVNENRIVKAFDKSNAMEGRTWSGDEWRELLTVDCRELLLAGDKFQIVKFNGMNCHIKRRVQKQSFIWCFVEKMNLKILEKLKFVLKLLKNLKEI